MQVSFSMASPAWGGLSQHMKTNSTKPKSSRPKIHPVHGLHRHRESISQCRRRPHDQITGNTNRKLQVLAQGASTNVTLDRTSWLRFHTCTYPDWIRAEGGKQAILQFLEFVSRRNHQKDRRKPQPWPCSRSTLGRYNQTSHCLCRRSQILYRV